MTSFQGNNASAGAAKAPGTIHGFIEHVGAAGVSGWCLSTDSPNERLALEFSLSGKIIGITACGHMREDLAAFGLPNGPYGFHFPLPRNLGDVPLDDLEARVFKTDHKLPRVPQAPTMAAAPAGRITIDALHAGGVLGWIRDDAHAAALAIELYLDAELVGSYPADLARKDVAETGLDSGRFGFRIPLPDRCFDGAPHALRLDLPALDESLQLALDEAGLALYPHGQFDIAQGLVAGRIDCRHLPAETDALEFFADGKQLSHLTLPKSGGAQFTFKFELPLGLSDGLLHNVCVALNNSVYRLRTSDGCSAAAYQTTIRGKIDAINTNGIEGWVYSLAEPDESIELELYDGATFLARGTTELARPDVNKLFGISGMHGFRFFFQQAQYDGMPHHFRVLHKGEALTRKQGQAYPVVLTPANMAALTPAQRYEGRVDSVTPERVSGWVVDRKNPADPVQVSLYVDEQLIDIVHASRFEARLRTQARAGHHVFLFRLPPGLMNGKKRSIKVMITAANHVLPNHAEAITFPLVDVLGEADGIDRQPNFSFTPPLQQYVPAAVLDRGYLVPAAGAPLISIIVLNLNGAPILRELLDSFLRIAWRHSYELLLVDHGSNDGSLEVAADFEDRLPLRVLARGSNYSFAASNNFGARHAKGKILCFANNDLVMLHDCLATMAEHLLDPQVGAVGLKLLEPIKAGPNKWKYITHHQGVNFGISAPLPGTGQRYYLPLEIGEDSSADLAAVYELPISTGALLLCRDTDFARLGGFFEGYFYGMEDVDLCLGIVQKLGKKVLCDTAAVALHNRSATRDSKLRKSDKEKMYNAQIHASNRTLYIERYGRHLTRTVLKALVAGEHFWRPKPLRVVFAVTDTDIATPAGDLFTAMELGEALRRLYGWDVQFVAFGIHMLPGTDVLIVMRHDYPVQKIVDANPGLVTIAWARNWIDKWSELPYLGVYQLIFCSSQKAIDHLYERSGRTSALLPIATNARRFAPTAPAACHLSDVTFTGNYWLFEREAIGLQNLRGAGYAFSMYGHGWDKCPEWQDHWRGAVAYGALPEIYSSASIVLDDSHPVTREWHSLNSRVFDAIGCGRLVLTNCSGGAQELFPDLLPHFDDAAQLQQLITHYLDHPAEREALAAKLQAEVLAHHTYDNRARTVRDALAAALDGRLRFAIKIGVPSMAEQEAWGDYHFALGIKRALEKQGHFARIDILPDWAAGYCAGDDVVIVLRGLSQYQPLPTAINLMWLISHPDDVKLSEFKQYDHVFVASDSFAQQLHARLGAKVSALLQCTDPALFHNDVDDQLALPDLLFVGNSRGQRREGVQYALESDQDFCVYGELWEGILPTHRVRGKHIPNQSLRTYYSSAKVVLNDHWPDMRDEGFISNRIFDAGACGAAILTDEMAACRKVFGDTLAYYDSMASLAEQTQALAADKDKRRKRGAKLAKLIHEKHTFDHRVADILAIVGQLNAAPNRL